MRSLWALCALALATLAGLALLMAVTGLDPLQWRSPFGPVCVFKRLFHLPCPTCGMTRAFLLLAQGRPFLASNYHPLALPLTLAMMLWIVAGPFQPALTRQALRATLSPWFLWTLGALIVVAWALKLSGPRIYW